MDIAKQCPTTFRMTALCAQGATSTSRAGQSYLITGSTDAKAAATKSCRHSHSKHDVLSFFVVVSQTPTHEVTPLQSQMSTPLGSAQRDLCDATV